MVVSTHRPTKIIVDLKAIEQNVADAIKCLSEGDELFAVVKANGYGHGAVMAARAAKKGGATGFCVATLDEALELREHGIEGPILLLGLIDLKWLPLLLAHEISISVATMAELQAAAKLMEQKELSGELRVHLAIDTGMGRIGFRYEESAQEELHEAVFFLKTHPQMLWEGLFTHYATADEINEDYWQLQTARLEQVLVKLPGKPRYIHVSNSANLLWHDNVGNMVRYGIAMYGLNPSGDVIPSPLSLRPALSLQSELVQVKLLRKGEGIGYGKTYETSKEEWIGTVPIGYADGYIRKMQGFYVLVAGQRCEIVGRVCMDQLMIRLPREFPVGTTVTLIGENSGEEITLQEVAAHIGTISYEVLCLLSERIPREYL